MSKPRLFMPQYIGEIVHAYIKIAPMVFPRSVICMEFASELNNACGTKTTFSLFYDEVQYSKYFFASYIFKYRSPLRAKEILHCPVPGNASINFTEKCSCTTEVGICLTSSKALRHPSVRSQAAESRSTYSYLFKEPDFLYFTQPEISHQGQRPSIKKPLKVQPCIQKQVHA